jgi:integrase
LSNPYAEDLLKKPLDEIHEDEMEYFIRDSINHFKLNRKGWLKLKALISGIWLYGKKTKQTELYITEFLEVLSISSKALEQQEEKNEEQVFTDEEVISVFTFIKQHKFSMVNEGIRLAFYAGLRCGELAALRWRDVSEDFRNIKIQSSEITYKDHEGKRHFEVVPHTKTKEGLRTITLPMEASLALKALYTDFGDNEFIFTNNDGCRIQGRVFSDKLDSICHQLGIVPRRLHKARKTVCSKLLDAHVDDRLILGQVGHTDRRTTEQYYHKDRRPQEEKCRIINAAINYG